MFRPISVQLSATIENDDLLRAAKLVLSLGKWQEGEAIKEVEDWFTRTFQVPWAVAFNSGRSALFSILKTLGVGSGDEVLLQAFTCVAVPNAIRWLRAKPVYVDIKENGYSMSVADLKKKISKKSKAIIIQHTFGYPDDVMAIKKISQERKLFLIEDCAHSLGNSYNALLLGSFGDAAIFSFGRDKVVSSVFGGMAITKNDKLGKKLKQYQMKLPLANHIWIFRQLFQPLAFSLILPLYKVLIGKLLLVFFQKAGFLSRPVESVEYYGGQPAVFPGPLPNALADLAINQLEKLPHFRERRKRAAQQYWEKLKNLPLSLPPKPRQALLRFPIIVGEPKRLIEAAKRKGIILGRWYSNIIDPAGVDIRKAGYILGSCPNAEKKAGGVVNLPTAPVLTKEEITKVITFIKQYFFLK